MNQKPSLQELYHFGIPGMKWGRRKSRQQPTTQSHPDHISKSKKKISEMSNAELQAFITRKNLEAQYQRYNPTKVIQGKRIVKALGKGLVVDIAKSMAKEKIKESIKRHARK